MDDYNICSHVVKQQVYASGDVSVLEEQVFTPRSAKVHEQQQEDMREQHQQRRAEQGDPDRQDRRRHSRQLRRCAPHRCRGQGPRQTVHTRCLHTSVPLTYIADHQANVAAIRAGAAGDAEPHLDNFSIANFTHRTKVSERKLQNLEGVFTRRKLDLQSHVGVGEDLTDAPAQSGKWFDRVVLLRGDEAARFADAYSESPPQGTFAHAGYTAESVRLLNELSGIRFVMQKLAQEQQQRQRQAGSGTSGRYASLYPHL